MSHNDSLIIFYVPCASANEAKTIAQDLLQKRLIACANLVPSTSLYRWNGEMKKASETILLLKAGKKNEQKICSIIEEMSSYECPCILRFTPSGVNDVFLKWATEQ